MKCQLIKRLTVIKSHPWRGIGIGGKVPVCMGIVPFIDIVPAFEKHNIHNVFMFLPFAVACKSIYNL